MQNLSNMLDLEDDRMFVIDSAIKHKLGSKEEIDLYEELSLALELMEGENFKVTGSGIGGGVDFSITTPYPDGLPESVGTMFFNVSNDFKVQVKETQQCANNGERHFVIKLNKL
jgi:hypothetical protein